MTTRPLGSVLILSDFTGASFDAEAIRVLKETGKFPRPHEPNILTGLTEESAYLCGVMNRARSAMYYFTPAGGRQESVANANPSIPAKPLLSSFGKSLTRKTFT